jgi:glycosyltransferase involved in cell wall biosynthesis
MTLVVNGRFLAARTTGIQRAARSLLETARAQGMEFTVLVPGDVQDPLADRSTPAVPGRLGRNAWEQFVLPVAARGQPVLSLANTAPVALRHAAVVVYDLATLVGPTWFRRDMRLYGRVSLAAARRAAVVFADSSQVAGELADAGVARARIHVIRLAIDPSFRPASDEEVAQVRRDHGLEREFVLHIGWADPRKDARLLVDAHVAAARRRPHDLVLVGAPHPNLAPVLLPEVPSVKILRSVGDVELRALLTGATVFAYPSRYEGFGLPPLEAMACGTPALVSDLPALHESAGLGARFLPSGDIEVWADAIVDALAGDVPPPIVPDWSWADTVEQLIEGLELL